MNFIKNRDPLIDTMRITLSEGTEPFQTSVLCFTKTTILEIKNNNILELSMSCSLIATHKLWAGKTIMRTEKELRSDNRLLNDQEGKFMRKVKLRTETL